jgi:hypothetical protein
MPASRQPGDDSVPSSVSVRVRATVLRKAVLPCEAHTDGCADSVAPAHGQASQGAMMPHTFYA